TLFEYVARQLTAAANTNDNESFGRLASDELISVDHILIATHDRGAFLENLRRSARMPGFHGVISVPACLGDRHGGFRGDITYPAGAGTGPWADVGGGENT